MFTIIDEKDGFWQIDLDEPSVLLCTFNSPFERFSWKRLPQGIKSEPEVFQRKNDQLFGDIEEVSIIFDDIIIAAEVNEDDDRILRKVLQRARETNVRFNNDKIQYKVSEVKFVGNIVSAEGLKPDPEKIGAINEMPTPQNKQGLQRLIGMLTYLSQFIPLMTTLDAPLRMLMVEDAI